MPYTKEEKAAYDRLYREKNRERRLALKKEYREANIDRVRLWAKQAAERQAAKFKADPKVAWLHRIWIRTKHRAKVSGIPLEAHQLECPDFCPVLGLKLQYGQRGGGGAANDSPSLDRIIPSLGYVPGNVRIISYRANVLLNNATAEELRKVADFRVEDERRQSAATSATEPMPAPAADPDKHKAA